MTEKLHAQTLVQHWPGTGGWGGGGSKEKEVKGSSLPNTLIVNVCVTEISRPWPKGDGGKT